MMPQARFLLSPSWEQGAFFDSASREPIPGAELHRHMRIEDDRAADAWILLFHDLADPDDPWRARYLAPDGAGRMEQAGRDLLRRLQEHAPGCWSMEPQPWPRGPCLPAATLRIRAEYEGEPLRVGDQPVRAHRLGISWNLSRDFERWQNRFDEDADPSVAGRWSTEERAAHEEQGAALALRLARELVATGREDTEVLHWSASQGDWRGIATARLA
ncbi:hypothetical protein EOD42_16190 [Rhodovarius crocodyli]|uniref:Uncharacterized protein n=1 Tax=Rhodovarius crocodyli TaxID=1979269 RepID=A0A437MDL5_9PROT|nr:hypothetical protein [Rhodovarius crocodyli]RVT95731.1 hypothetical protein EOD42_16190 [Rhodovarius crocodyli]